MNNQPFYNNIGIPANMNVPQANWNQPTMFTQPQQVQNIQPPPQSFNTAPPRTYINGRIINDEKEIRPNEVPGDGSVAIFPFMDRSKILVREVTENGTIANSVYVLEQGVQTQNDSAQNDIMTPIMERLDNIEKMIKRNSRYYKKPTTKKDDEA